MSGERKTCGCGRVPINADGLCSSCDDEMWIAGQPVTDEEIRAMAGCVNIEKHIQKARKQ